MRAVKERPTMYLCLLVAITLGQLCVTECVSRQKTKHRLRRQTADFVLWNLNAKHAMGGTTRSADYIQRIGRKRSEARPFPDSILLPVGGDDDFAEQADVFQKRW